MMEEALYTWIFDGLKMGFGSTILVTLILFLMSTWYFVDIVKLDNLFFSLSFAAIPFIAGGVIGLLTLSWGLAVAILLIGFIFSSAIASMVTNN